MRIGIFEDNGYINLQPLTYLRPTFELRCGMYLLREKIEKLFNGSPVDLFVRSELNDCVVAKNPNKSVNNTVHDDYLFLNGRAIISKKYNRPDERFETDPIIQTGR